MGLGYLIVFGMALGAISAAIVLLKASWETWKKARLKVLAIFPLLLAVLCAVAAFYLIAVILREPPWRFHF